MPAIAAYNMSKAPNDQAYGVESWAYIRNAIKKGKVTAYNAWNMVLDKSGLGIDTTRDWKQDALLVAGSGTVTPTPAYYVFRHCSQYVQPGATVVGDERRRRDRVQEHRRQRRGRHVQLRQRVDVHRPDQGSEAVVHDAGQRLGDRRRPLRRTRPRSRASRDRGDPRM